MTAPQDSRRAEYWKMNLKLVATLLTIWFVVSYLFEDASVGHGRGRFQWRRVRRHRLR